MRGKRSKQYRKQMQQYGLHFGFREPYQVLLDAGILRDAYRFKMDFVSGLAKALHGEVKPMITQCCIRHLYASEPKDSVLLQHAKAFERRRCNHHTLEQPLSEHECIVSVVDPKGMKNNKHRYVVASQDEPLRDYLRTIPGVPLIFLTRSVMIMESMPTVTKDVRETEERAKFRSGLKGKRGPGQELKRQRDETEQQDHTSTNGTLPAGKIAEAVAQPETIPAKKKQRRGPSGPNPLSMKKPKGSTKWLGATAATDSNSVHSNTYASKADSLHDAVQMPKEQSKRKRPRRHKSAKEPDSTSNSLPLVTPTPLHSPV